ncbi:MAG: hypothetical protein ACJASO_002812, partial [Cyclobacteriaceae bacterium]
MCNIAAVKAFGTYLLIIFLGCWSAKGQILDDSTKQVYGPTTTKVFTESGLIFNKLDTIYVDTSQYRIERFAFTDRLNREYQDLGNIGTA